MTSERHPLEQLLDFVDGRLTADARHAVDAHVRGCGACQAELAALTAARDAARSVAPPPLPDGLEARILGAIEAADTTTGESGAAGDPRPPVDTRAPATPPARLPWLALAALAAALVLAAVLWWRPTGDLPDAAAGHVRAHAARQLTLTSDATTADAVHAYLTPRVAFPVRVFDLGMMGFSVAGAGVVDLAGRPAAAWIYQGAAGWLLCEMLLATPDDLPAADETRTANGIVFHIYHRDGGTQVFWAEGDVLCVLASTLPADDVVELAIAKAMAP